MKRLFELLESMEKFVMLWTALALMFLLVVTVILRYLLNTDLYGIDEPEICVAFWLYFIGSAHCSNKGTQITADIVTFIVRSDKLKLYVKLFTNVVSFLVCAIFTYWSFGLVHFAVVQMQRSLVWRLPVATYYVSVVIGLALMALYYLRDTIRNVSEIRGSSQMQIAEEGD